MLKLGAQCQMNKGALLEYCRVVRPKAAMGIMVQDHDFYEELARLATKPIYRHFPNFDWVDAPEVRAAQAVATLAQECKEFTDKLSWWEDNNEYIYSFMHAEHDLADRYASSVIAETHKFNAANGRDVHVVALNLNTGHFRDDVMVFKRTLKAINDCGKCRLGWHEYDWPEMDSQYRDGLMKGDDGCWQTLRWKPAMAAIKKAGYTNVKIGITECGLDAGVIPGQPNWGFRKTHINLNEAVANYKRSWAWYIEALERDDDVDFAIAYGCGMNDDWKSFDISGTNIPQWIAGYKIYPEVK